MAAQKVQKKPRKPFPRPLCTKRPRHV